jgi:hypothetical protein
MRATSRTRSVDARIGELADRQHGVVSRRQLVASGLTPAHVSRRLERGRTLPPRRYGSRRHPERSAPGCGCAEPTSSFWPSERVIVEVDGWTFHGDQLAFARDRAKTNALQLAGYAVLRFTASQVHGDPTAVLARIGAALRASRHRDRD